MGFGDEVLKLAETVRKRNRDVFVESVNAVRDSIKEGSSVTAAPGQPVDIGNLLTSWQRTFPDHWRGLVATNSEYAEAIEEGQQEPYTTASGTEVRPRPMTRRSEVGGFHSVALTRAGWLAVVDDVTRKVVP